MHSCGFFGGGHVGCNVVFSLNPVFCHILLIGRIAQGAIRPMRRAYAAGIARATNKRFPHMARMKASQKWLAFYPIARRAHVLTGANLDSAGLEQFLVILLE